MSANSTQRAAELSALIGRHSTLPPHQIAAHVLHLQRIARQLKAIAERQCNGYHTRRVAVLSTGRTAMTSEWDDRAAQRDEKRAKRLAIHAQACCSNMVGLGGLLAKCGGDPRGPCLRLLIEGERGDGFDQASDGTGSYAVY